jgi:septal ring-binding cell division protein DamX/type II secretory pathway predicted ATPase ExeA
VPLDNQNLGDSSALGLQKDPFTPEPDPRYYYAFDSFEQRLAMLNHLVQGTDIIVLVIGERGSGKTTLLHRYLTSTDTRWESGRIRIDTAGTSSQTSGTKTEAGHPAFILQESRDPIVIVDDAHELSRMELHSLLQETLVPGTSRKIKRLVLFCEPSINTSVAALVEALGGDTAVDKIYMPALTGEESAVYLQHRLAVAGYGGKNPFSASVVKKLHKQSGGLPGQMNANADQWLKGPPSRKPWYKSKIGWTVAGIAVILLIALWLYPNRKVLVSKPIVQKPSANIYRAKVPATEDSEKSKPISSTIQKPIVTPPTTEEKKISQLPPASPPGKIAELEKVEIQKFETLEIKEPEKPEFQPFDSQPVAKQPAVVKEKVKEEDIHREKWLLSQNPSYYTIQIVGVRSEETLLNFIKEHKLAGKGKLAYYRTTYKGEVWFPLLYGVYATKKEALAAIKELPPKIQASTPWLRRMSAVQSDTRKR